MAEAAARPPMDRAHRRAARRSRSVLSIRRSASVTRPVDSYTGRNRQISRTMRRLSAMITPISPANTQARIT